MIEFSPAFLRPSKKFPFESFEALKTIMGFSTKSPNLFAKESGQSDERHKSYERHGSLKKDLKS